MQLCDFAVGNGQPFFLIAGPCVIESESLALESAGELKEICAELGIPFIYKSSIDKANRSSHESYRGPGLEEGLRILDKVRQDISVPILTDVHEDSPLDEIAAVVDVLQTPAFLCRQTNFIQNVARQGKPVNIKKGQFLAPWDMQNVVAKCEGAGNPNVLVTERGSTFGYGRLVVDMSGFADLDRSGKPVVFDATHSVQRPGGADGRTGGDRSLVPDLARAAVATGRVDGLFFEVHPDPDRAPSDGPNMVRLDDFGGILDGVLAVHRAVRG